MDVNDNNNPKDNLNENKESWGDKLDETKENISEKYDEVTDKISDSIEGTKENINKTVKSGVKKTKSFFKRLFAGIFILALLAFAGYMFYCNMTFSEGTRTGQLIKISKKGYVFKTLEGQLNTGGIQGAPDGTMGTIWNFSLKDKSLYQKMEELEGKKVMMRYREKFKAMPWQGDTNYFVYEIEERE